MINRTLEEIEQTLAKFRNPIVAFSGGKDGFVVAHMCSKVMPNIKMVCELSFCFEEQVRNIKEIATRHKFNVTYVNGLTDEWLLKNKNVIFTNDSKARGRSFQQRQQKTVNEFAKQCNADISIFGRRLEENTVPKMLYKTKNGYQYHPLREWTETDIWNYFEYVNEPKPFIYSTRFGQMEGNAPFYSMQRGNMTTAECWNIINEVDTEKKFYQKFR